MGIFLNSIAPYESYKELAGTRFFADKTDLIAQVIQSASDGQKYLCITRPRRFGKTVMATMLGAFYGKAADGKSLFDGLNIAGYEQYHKHLNKWDVIYIDFSRLPRNCSSYERYIGRIQNGMNKDLAEAYPQYQIDIGEAVWDNLQLIFEKTRTRFIFFGS